MKKARVAALSAVLLAIVAGACRTPPPTPSGALSTRVAATQTAVAPGDHPIPIEELRTLFDYDATAPLDVQETAVERRDDVAIHDLSYASPMGGRVTAYLVVPPGAGPFAGIIFHHPGGGSRASMLEEAVSLAPAGAVSLLVDAPWARPDPWNRDLEYTPEQDREMYVQNTVDLRRGIDLLAAREDVDPERLGFVGHSYGAHMGGVLAGVESRVRAYVFMAGVPSLSERVPSHVARVLPDLATYLEAINLVDAVRYVGDAAPATLFFQCARQDEVIAEEASLRFYQAASEPKQIAWYDTGHSLDDQARLDRARWLAEQIGLDPAAVVEEEEEESSP